MDRCVADFNALFKRITKGERTAAVTLHTQGREVHVNKVAPSSQVARYVNVFVVE